MKINYVFESSTNLDEYGNKIITDYFISNCLIEAIKASIFDHDIKIVRHKVKGTFIPHFTWFSINAYYGKLYQFEFGTNHKIATPFLYQGYIRKFDSRTREGYYETPSQQVRNELHGNETL